MHADPFALPDPPPGAEDPDDGRADAALALATEGWLPVRRWTPLPPPERTVPLDRTWGL